MWTAIKQLQKVPNYLSRIHRLRSAGHNLQELRPEARSDNEGSEIAGSQVQEDLKRRALRTIRTRIPLGGGERFKPLKEEMIYHDDLNHHHIKLQYSLFIMSTIKATPFLEEILHLTTLFLKKQGYKAQAKTIQENYDLP